MFALIIKDENGYEVVNHVSNYSDDTVFVPCAQDFKLPQQEWRKSFHLTEYVAKNKPNWKVYTRTFEIVVKNEKIVFSES